MAFKLTGDLETNKLIRRINREKIREPEPDQYVGPCHWSKTGWGIWNKSGGCTCMPARKPAARDHSQGGAIDRS